MIVGLTGGIATGKSTVTAMLRELGAYVVDADVWARKVVEPGSQGLSEIAAAFGPGVLLGDGALNRPALGRIVFGDESARQTLNQITHPKVREGMKQETLMYFQNHPSDPIVWDVPLLFEGDTKYLVDVTVLVYVPEDVQLTRLMQRDGLSESDAKARIKAQMPIEEKRTLATYVIHNSGTPDETKEQVVTLWETLQNKAAVQ
ncbi:dephospho-CoA kinase [Alicyclobacillus ferrooxydans]|uniref:Dephospho-CoA kinase n=1 Tax=Alicyclobacillus ferrooxydans TaxID=471514 RepID=A0A0P9D0W9_9BACL|nr:dephospho-CoA kinase [Alicyclobacillus ferrooxydans]KPV45802.1 dephospho-CoA kinase [Alicyclobacillus ferrooxydans]